MNQNQTIDTNLLRQIFFIVLILVLGIVLFLELWFFLSAFLGAITFYVIMRERMFYLTEKKRLETKHSCVGTNATFLFRNPRSNWSACQYHVLQGQLCSYTFLGPDRLFKENRR